MASESASLWREAAAYLSRGEATPALELMRRDIEPDETDLDKLILFGQTLLAAGHGDDALSVVERALAIAPSDSRAQLFATTLEAAFGKEAEALARVESLPDATLEERDATWLRASLLLSRGIAKPAEALKILDAAIPPEGPADEGLLELALTAHMQQQNQDAVLATAARMLAQGCRSITPIWVLAAEDLQKGRGEHVIETLTKSERALLDHPRVAAILSAAYERLGKTGQANTWKIKAQKGVPAVFGTREVLDEWIGFLQGDSHD